MGEPLGVVATEVTVEVVVVIVAFMALGLAAMILGLIAALRSEKSGKRSPAAAAEHGANHEGEATLTDLAERLDALAGVVAATVLVQQLEDKAVRKRSIEVLKVALERTETLSQTDPGPRGEAQPDQS